MADEAAQPVEAKPEAKPAASVQTLIDQYELGDTVNDPSYEQAPPTRVQAETLAEPAQPESTRLLPPRGPDGKFQKTESSVPPEGENQPAANREVSPARSNRLVQMALDYGIPDAEIEEMTPAELERTVFHLHRQTQAIRRDNDRQQILQQVSEPNQNLIQRETETETPHDPSVDEDLGFDPSEYDPNLVGALKKLAQQNKELRAQVGQLHQREQFRQNVEAGNRIDKAFFALNAPDIYGDLPMNQMTQADAGGHRRLAILKIVEGMAKDRGSLEDKIAKAHKLLYPSAAPAQQQEPPARTNGATRITEEDWEASRVARPTHRGGAPEPKGREAAERAVAQALRDMEASGETADTSLDGFPE